MDATNFKQLKPVDAVSNRLLKNPQPLNELPFTRAELFCENRTYPAKSLLRKKDSAMTREL